MLAGSGRNISSIQFTGSIKILIISLLFRQAQTQIVGISLSFIFDGKVNCKTFPGINHPVIVRIDKAVHTKNQLSRIHGNRSSDLLLIRYSLSLFLYLIISHQTGRECSIRSSVSNDTAQHFILSLHIHILIDTGQSLHIHFRSRFFFKNLQEQIFCFQQISGSFLTNKCIFGVAGYRCSVIDNLCRYIKIRTCQSCQQFKIIRRQSIQTFINIQSLQILSLSLQNTCLNRQYLQIIRV